MEFPPIQYGSSTSSSPRRSAPHSPSGSPARSPQQGGTPRAGTPTSSSTTPSKTNVFSRFFTKVKDLIAEAATIEATSDVAPGVDHCCKTSRCHYGLPIHHLDSESLLPCAVDSTTSSSSKVPQVCSRLIVYRDCDRRGRKILFDSEHVSSSYEYLKPTDPKLLKELGEYVFGSVPLASTSSALDLPLSQGHKRFCKWKLDEKHETPNKTLYIWSKIFELGSYNRSTKHDNVTATDYSSSSSEHSSSGYESGGGVSSSGSNVAGKTFSLPLFQQRPPSSRGGGSQSSISQTRSLPGRIDNYKTNLALVWILTREDAGDNGGGSASIPFPYLSPLVEKLMLNPLSQITKNVYHNSNAFVSSLKNIGSALSHDVRDFLGNRHVVNLSLVKPPLPDMVNSKLVCKFLEMILANPDSCIVLHLKKWTEVKAILYFLKMFLRTCVCKCGLLDSRRDSLVETGTDVVSANELDGVDSGIGLEGSSSARFHTVSTSSMYKSARKWSIVSEEGSDVGGGDESSQDEGDCGRVSFHLGDADADVDQSESKLALGDVDLSRLKGRDRRSSIDSTTSGEGQQEYTPSPVRRPPLEVKLALGDGKLKDSCSAKYTPCYHCNGTYVSESNRFNPFYFCQVMTNPNLPVTYDMEYVTFMKIIELYGSGLTRSFNLNEDCGSSSGSISSSSISLSTSLEDSGEGGNELVKKIKEFVEGYVQLAKVTNDTGKLNSFATFQMEELRDFIL